MFSEALAFWDSTRSPLSPPTPYQFTAFMPPIVTTLSPQSQLERESALGRALVGMEVFVNGDKLGTVKNGETEVYKFETKDNRVDGDKNVLFLKIPGLTDAKSDRIRFGRVAIFKATYSAGLLGDSITVQIWDLRDKKWRDVK